MDQIRPGRELRWRLIDQEIPLHNALTANSLVTSGPIASSHPAVCGVQGTISTKTARRENTSPQLRHAATASWRKGRQRTPPTNVVADMQKLTAGGRGDSAPRQLSWLPACQGRDAREKDTAPQLNHQEERSLRIFQHPDSPLLRHSVAPQSSPNNSNKTGVRKYNVVNNLIKVSQSGPHRAAQTATATKPA
jgi:hypothetical protein